MGSAWETLREAVASLTEAEATKTLDYLRRLRGSETTRVVASLLAGDPAFHLPDEPAAPLPPVEPLRGMGIPASKLLIQDRR